MYALLLTGDNNLVPLYGRGRHADTHAGLFGQRLRRLVERPTDERVVDLGDRQAFKRQLSLQHTVVEVWFSLVSEMLGVSEFVIRTEIDAVENGEECLLATSCD